MNYKPSDTMNLVHEVKKLGWHFTHSKENISINRHDITLSLYREADPEAWREENLAKQAAGVKFEKISAFDKTVWVNGRWFFDGNKEDYREVPQEVSGADYARATLEHIAKTYCADKGMAQLTPPTPPAAERALWKAQREAGTNEVWQIFSRLSKTWCDLVNEPKWYSDTEYRVKPMKLTAKIIRRGVYKTSYDWEFTGTREEYRAECEKYGYVVVSNIEEVKPKTVTYYFVLFKTPNGRIGTGGHRDKQKLTDYWVKKWGYTIIGDIEEREIEV